MKDTPVFPSRPPLSADELLAHLEAHLENGLPFALTVTGVSMVPFLRHGRDSVLLVSPDRRRARRGEILFYRRPDGSLILHRCLKIYKDGSFLLNGDSQRWRERQSADALLAVAETICRDRKRISCDTLPYRILAGIWMRCRPFRPIIFRSVALVRRLLGKPADPPVDTDRP